MNEIEKLYELADVQSQYKKRIECKEGHRVGQPCGKCPCINCDKSIFEDVMPLFTADKQIELIKWLSKRRLLNVAFSDDKSTYQLFNNKCTGSFCSDLATAIATLVQCELDFCTEEEKEQVKGILNK